ncbi:hypothetical protein D3C81_1505840 [compost metagenome]
MLANNLIMLRTNIEATVFLSNMFHCRKKDCGILDMLGIGQHCRGQRCLLSRILLVSHIEDMFKLRIVSKHTFIKITGQRYTMFF